MPKRSIKHKVNMNFTFLEQVEWTVRPGPSRSSTTDNSNSTSSPPPYHNITNHGPMPTASTKYLPAPPTTKHPSRIINVYERERRPYSSVNEVDETLPLLPRTRQTSNFKFTCTPEKMLVLLAFIVLHIFIISLLWILKYAPHPLPPTSWVNVTASPFCSSVGSRIYTAVSSHMPEGFHADTQCMKWPVHIHGRLVTPFACYSEPLDREISVDGSDERRNVTCTITRGKWLVDWNEESCIPTWDVVRPYNPGPVPDAQCQTHRERGYTAFMTVSRIPPGLEAVGACKSTSAIIHGQHVFPAQCQKEKRKGGIEVVRARFFVEEPSCLPVWVNLTASPVCTSIGSRMYTAVSSHMPLGYQPDLHCSNRPIEIHRRVIPQPLSCHSEAVERIVYNEIDESPHRVIQTLTTGEWLVDFEEKSCTPTWDPNIVPDNLFFIWETRIHRIHDRFPQQVFPVECHLDNGVVRARFVVDDGHGCATAVWTEVQPDYQCSEYGIKRYTGFLERIPDGLDPMEVCGKVEYLFFGVKEKRPDQCEKVRDGDGVERVRGSWMIDIRVPECHPVLRELEDKGCAGSNIKRAEAQVHDIGEHEDWYRMCTTTPLWWDGVKHLPVQCESRTIWFRTYRYALYDIRDPTCR